MSDSGMPPSVQAPADRAASALCRRPLRVAWIGPTPTASGVPYIGAQLLRGLTDAGTAVDCYLAGDEPLAPGLADSPSLRVFRTGVQWQWNRWYSRQPLSAFVTGQTARAVAQARLAGVLVEQHREHPYDVIYQFSQIEVFRLRQYHRRLPPIVVHPEVHASGELQWHRREALLAAAEPRLMHAGARAMLIARAWLQRWDATLASMLIAPSQRFAEHLTADYGIPAERLRVLPNPIDLERFQPPAQQRPSTSPLTLLYVSRLSVRKGVELVVALSHRLSDLRGRVRIVIAGDRSLWSDYRSLLAGLNTDIATYAGYIGAEELPSVYRQVDAVLQPSHYEPFALTVAEALASGAPVVASDEVGAAENVDRRCCRVFPAGDLDCFERTVRRLLGDLTSADAVEMKTLARREAERLFAPDLICRRLLAFLQEASAEPRDGAAAAGGAVRTRASEREGVRT